MPHKAAQNEMSDVQLLEAAQKDEASFELLMARFERNIFRFARSLVRSDEDAEDVLQQTFLSIWDALQKGHFPHVNAQKDASKNDKVKNDKVKNVRSWIFTIARHAAYRKGRRRVGEPAYYEELAQEGLEKLGLDAGWGIAENPEAHLAKIESAQQMQRSFVLLSAEHREVLMLRDVLELSTNEAAEVMNLSVAALKSILHRARLKLAGILRNLQEETL